MLGIVWHGNTVHGLVTYISVKSNNIIFNNYAVLYVIYRNVAVHRANNLGTIWFVCTVYVFTRAMLSII